MRLTIIVDDNMVSVGGRFEKVDCSSLIAQDIHAVQWYGTSGEIEYASDQTGARKPNKAITDISPFQYLIDAWAAVVNAPPPPLPPPPAPQPPSLLSQDLMAQFTVADYGLIKVAVANSDQFGLLWSSLQAQRDPMLLTNARFLAGWNALVQVLGQARMNVIAGPAPGLNLPSLIV